MRSRLEHQLETLRLELRKMGALCEEAISAGVKALLECDDAMAQRAIACEEEIDEAEHSIEALCMKLLLQQQPVARDLRTISSALKMISDMERIGDQAADIAHLSAHFAALPLPGQIHIGDMARAAIRMVTDSVESFAKKDLNMALGVIQYDDVVDGLFLSIQDELIALIRTDSTAAVQALDLLMVAKYLERIGDHAVNVAQWVIYSITGEYQTNAQQGELL
ncbi:MAG: phosphate signaling complex protein PhoU [Oscillospiraceae bacterium]|nr:phosphate signaling complex protein PhoU [Oscillospiraceae bacterium]